MYRFLLADSAQASGVRYTYWSPEKLDDPQLVDPDFSRFKVILVSGRRSDPISRPVQAALARSVKSGASVIVLPAHDTQRLGVGNADFAGQERWIDDYWRFGGVENMSRLMQTVAARHLGKAYKELPPVPTPDDGFYHPGSPALFTSTDAYKRWYESSGRYQPDAPKVLIDFADGWRLGMDQATNAIIEAFEDGGFNSASIFGTMQTATFALEYKPDILVSRKHGRWWLGKAGVDVLDKQLNIPMLRGLSLLFTGESFSEYQKTRAGIRDAGLIMGAMVPEMDGAIQPTLIEGLDAEWYGRRYEAFQSDRISLLVERAKHWVRLKTLANKDKKIAIFYVSGIGKGRITAAGLNLPRSMIRFLNEMQQQGYAVDSFPSDEDALLEEMLAKGRNVSQGRQRDLEELAAQEGVLQLPIDGYLAWYQNLPEEMRSAVEAAFGPPPGDLMTIESEDGIRIVIPKLEYGNVIVLPQPVRGASMDAKLQHNDQVPPPHQYLAVYWWLQHVWQADAILHYGTHGTHEFLPGRPLGQLANDWSDRILGALPNIYVYVMDNVGEALIAKRRGAAVTVSHQIPPVDSAKITQEDREVDEIYRATLQFASLQEGTLKETLRKDIQAIATAQDLDEDLEMDWSVKLATDQEINALSAHIHLIDQDLVPLGLHVHGQANDPEQLAPMITVMLGDDLLKRVGCDRIGIDQAREIATRMVRHVLRGGTPAAVLQPDVAKLEELHQAFIYTGTEIDKALDALAGGYVLPGGGGSPLRNPQSLPTGRNLYGINPAEVPTKAAWEVGGQLADAQLEAELKRLGRWPRKIGFTLWNTELIRQYGTDLAHILYLLGVQPVWDHLNVVEDVELIPLEKLGRPRIDVIIQAASLFRDTFPDRMKLLDKAVRLAASASELDNYVSDHTQQAERALKQVGLAAKDARILAGARIFSNSAGGYGTGLVDSIERSGDYTSTQNLTEAYLARAGAVYTEGFEWGKAVPEAYRQHLLHTDAVTLSRSTNVVGALTLDHYFEYLGGMTMAVRDTTGISPETYLADVRDPNAARIETVRESLVRGLRGKFWNPKWIRELQREGYSGAVEMAQTSTNLFGWQITKPEAVNSYIWDQVHEVYVLDKHDLGLENWFDDHNPHAYQEMLAVMLETARKGFWNPGEDTLEDLSLRYARSLSRHGASGSIRTSSNSAFETALLHRVSLADQTELLATLQVEFQSGGPASVEGQRLVEQSSQNSDTPSMIRSRFGLAFLCILACIFWIGWRRRR